MVLKKLGHTYIFSISFLHTRYVSREMRHNRFKRLRRKSSYWVEFQLAEGVSLAIQERQAAFGAYTELKRMTACLPKVTFKLDWPDMPYTCTLIGEVETAQSGNLAEGYAKSILMRRDIRLT